jgi:hypothetical protein
MLKEEELKAKKPLKSTHFHLHCKKEARIEK